MPWIERTFHHRLVLAAGAAVIALAAAGSSFLMLNGGEDELNAANPSPAVTATVTATTTATPATPSPTPTPLTGILDGVTMSPSEWAERKDLRPIAVMIDNTAGGVPQAGLDRADVVYEALVEGGITRFMAVFWRRDAELLLPIRSARTPFVIWASELDALYAHAGGAQTNNDANAIGQIYEWGVHDLDSFVTESSTAYHRVPDRFAPYNLATSTGALRIAAAAIGSDGPVKLEPWLFAEDRSRGGSAGQAAGGIELSFRTQRLPSDLIQWHWDPLTNTYLRFQWGGPHESLPGLEQLRFKNIVVMRAAATVVDFSGHVVLEQYGEGPAQVFLDGIVIEGTWRKKDRESRTRYYDTAGREIAFNRGPIFVEVLPPNGLEVIAATASALPPLPEYEPYIPPAPTPTTGFTPVPFATATPRPSATSTPPGQTQIPTVSASPRPPAPR